MKFCRIIHRRQTAVLLCLCAASLYFSSDSGRAQATIFYTWEDGGSQGASDDSESIRMGGRGESEGGPVYSIGNARFGAGSLAIKESRTGLTGFPNQEFVPEFSSEINRLTISCQIKPSAELDMRVLLLTRYAGDPKYAGSFKFFLEDNTLKFSVQTENAYLLVQSPPIPPIDPDTWTHLAVTFKDGEVTFYFNGDVFGLPEKMEVNSIPAVEMETKRAVFHIFSGLPDGSFADDFAYMGGEALSEKDIHRLYVEGVEAFNSKR